MHQGSPSYEHDKEAQKTNVIKTNGGFNTRAIYGDASNWDSFRDKVPA